MKAKLCAYLRPKLHPLLLDTALNTPATVRLNLYQVGPVAQISPCTCLRSPLCMHSHALCCRHAQQLCSLRFGSCCAAQVAWSTQRSDQEQARTSTRITSTADFPMTGQGLLSSSGCSEVVQKFSTVALCIHCPSLWPMPWQQLHGALGQRSTPC